MPYIKQKERDQVDLNIDILADRVRDLSVNYLDQAGVLNYCITRLIQRLFPLRKYWMFALVCGVLVTVVLEFYRRIVGPCEDEKIEENGDVY